jgi:hypothetical protein
MPDGWDPCNFCSNHSLNLPRSIAVNDIDRFVPKDADEARNFRNEKQHIPDELRHVTGEVMH